MYHTYIITFFRELMVMLVFKQETCNTIFKDDEVNPEIRKSVLDFLPKCLRKEPNLNNKITWRLIINYAFQTHVNIKNNTWLIDLEMALKSCQ